MTDFQKKQPAAKGNRTSATIDYSKLQELWNNCFGSSSASALAELIPLAKQQRVQAWILSQPNYAEFQKLLTNEIPKTRKNTARLMGQLKNPLDLPLLIQASKNETTLFVVPSILLAIGAFDSADAAAALQDANKHWSKFPTILENSKHLNEIHRALSLANSRREELPSCSFTGFPKNTFLNLYSMHRCISILKNETDAYSIPTQQIGEYLQCSSSYSEQVQQLRCAWMHLLPLTTKPCHVPKLSNKSTELNQWIQALTGALDRFVEISTHSFDSVRIHYRIELSNFPHTYRAAFSQKIDQYIQQKSSLLHNSSTQYHLELRIEYDEKKQTCSCFLHPLIPQDQRFSYRIGSLPASIHPVTAATLMRFALPHLKENARVLDPCCGSGTLLIERSKIAPTDSLVGVDKSNAALTIARENAKSAQQTAEFIGGRLESFQPDDRFDEVIANLPFGTRVGTHQSIQEIHRALFERLPEFLTSDGFAILYSTQIRFIRQLAKEYHWNILDQMQFDAGGLQPWGLILQQN